MKRNIFKQLVKWKNRVSRNPLILKGARQVGKTYVLKTFGELEFEQCAYINFEQDNRAKQIFDQDLQPDRIIKPRFRT